MLFKVYLRYFLPFNLWWMILFIVIIDTEILMIDLYFCDSRVKILFPIVLTWLIHLDGTDNDSMSSYFLSWLFYPSIISSLLISCKDLFVSLVFLKHKLKRLNIYHFLIMTKECKHQLNSLSVACPLTSRRLLLVDLLTCSPNC